MQCCKPVSRILSGAIIYLVPALLRESICLPFPIFPQREISPGRQSMGIYMAFQHTRFTHYICYHIQLWALTSHFHPYHAFGVTVIFCGTFSTPEAWPAVNRCVALCCPDFPHCSLMMKQRDSMVYSSCKDNIILFQLHTRKRSQVACHYHLPAG